MVLSRFESDRTLLHYHWCILPAKPQPDASNYDNSQVFLSCTATRHVFIIDTNNQKLGKIAVIQIGMVVVSSCIPTVKEGEFIGKGLCIGSFELGDSSQVILFEKKAKLIFSPKIHERKTINGFKKSTRQLVNSKIARLV
jgi:phosphatidylserine decarboxylase